MSKPIVQTDNLVKIYKTKDIEVVALQGLDLTVDEGELMAIIGSSGSGKSTFLNMIGGLDHPSAGKLFVDGKNLFTMKEKELVEYKRNTVGFVWQNNGRNLLPYLSAYENILIPMQLNGEKDKEGNKEGNREVIKNEERKKERAKMLLDLIGLSSKRNNSIQSLSGGEQQRVAIAIALANAPKILLADEPTGSVDSKTSDAIFSIFQSLNKEFGQTIIIVTHDLSLSNKVQRVAAIRDGKISSERILKENYAERIKNAGNEIDWHTEETQEEFAVIDRFGRIQIPSDLLKELNLTDNKMKVSLKKGKIYIEKP